MFGGMDDDGFYYVRTLGGMPPLTSPAERAFPQLGGDGRGFLMDVWRNGWSTSHDRDVDPRLFLQGLLGQGGGAEASFLVSVSPVSSPQGELNGQRGLVPSNFLEGPGPEVGGSNSEPRTPQAESQVSEELGSQLNSQVSILLVWWWGQGRVVGGVQGVMIQ